jgi:hypothetical protein
MDDSLPMDVLEGTKDLAVHPNYFGMSEASVFFHLYLAHEVPKRASSGHHEYLNRFPNFPTLGVDELDDMRLPSLKIASWRNYRAQTYM